MNTTAKKISLTASLALIAQLGFSQVLSHYSLDWFTISSGSGSLGTNSLYSAHVTIGQAIASPGGTNSGTFNFAGGFWTLFGFPTSEGVVTNYDYGVGFCSNRITGTLHFINSNPAILSLLNAEGMGGYYIFADSVPSGRSSGSGFRTTTGRTISDYAVTVDTDCTNTAGIPYLVTPRVSLGLGEQQYYYFRAQTSAPVVVGLAGPVLNFEECLGVVQFNFVDDSGAPVSVNSGTIGTDYAETANALPNGATGARLYVRGGEPRWIFLRLNRGTDVYSDRQVYSTSRYLTVACDTILNVNVVIPAAGALGQITGTLDMLREFEWTVHSASPFYAELSAMIANWGPFYNERWTALAGDNATVPASGTFTLPNLVPSTADPNSSGYAVQGHLLIRSNRLAESFWTPGLGYGSNPPVAVTPGATVNLSNIFEINPGYVGGAIRLQGPAETPGHASMLRGLFHCGDNDANHDGIPDNIGNWNGVYWSCVQYEGVDRRATGAQYTAAQGWGWGDFDGNFDAPSSAYLGSYELALGGLQGERSFWRQGQFGLLLENPDWTGAGENDYDNTYTIVDHNNDAVEIVPTQATTRDLAYGFSEVLVHLYSPSSLFSHPSLYIFGGLTGTNFLGQSADYSVSWGWAAGTPYYYETNRAQIRVLLPEGTYTLNPYVAAGGGSVGLAPIDLTVHAGQRLDLGNCLRLDLAIPTHSSSNQLNLAGSVLTSCGNNVTEISYQLNGGLPVTVCNNCGVNPNFAFTVPLQVGANSLTVTARDDQGAVSSISGTIQVDASAPPALSISVTSTNTVLVSWPSPSTGFSLQQASDLGTANWGPVSETVNDNGSTRFIIVNPPAGKRFYRLIKASP